MSGVSDLRWCATRRCLSDGGEPLGGPRDVGVLPWCSAGVDGLRSGWTRAYIRYGINGQAGQSVDWPGLEGQKRLDQRRLLIRGFGVRVPGGAPMIKALSWYFSPIQSLFRVFGAGRALDGCSGAVGPFGRMGDGCRGGGRPPLDAPRSPDWSCGWVQGITAVLASSMARLASVARAASTIGV